MLIILAVVAGIFIGAGAVGLIFTSVTRED